MNFIKTFRTQFDETEFESDETELRPCKYCEAYHAEDSEFCRDECERGYKWEYEQDFYTSQIREQE